MTIISPSGRTIEPIEVPTQQDLLLVNAAVDAKFDMLRSAIAESTDFATLKARLMAVLQ